MENSDRQFQGALELHGLRIDFERNVISSDGLESRVEPLIMALLKRLSDDCNHVVPRSELMDAVWGESAGGEQSLTNAVSQLRKIFRSHGASSIRIETIPKRGYRLIAPLDSPDESDAPVVRVRKAGPRALFEPRWLAFSLAFMVSVAIYIAFENLFGFSSSADKLEPGDQFSLPALPSDPATSEIFVSAREQWAQRTPDSLRRAIAGLVTVTNLEPEFAQGHAALAEAYLLAQEFGSMQDADAFPKAREAAQRALALDENLADAHRSLAFVRYWWDHDAEKADSAMSKAIALRPRDGLTHFWYANMLADNGAHDAAGKRFRSARLLNPDTIAIKVDAAWAQWLAGDRQPARAALESLAQDNAKNPVIFEALASIALAEDDLVAHVDYFETFAKLRASPPLLDDAAARRRALDGGRKALGVAILESLFHEIESGTRRSHVWPAFVASHFGDRDSLLKTLELSDQRNEKWGISGVREIMRQDWRSDAEISELLRRREPAPMTRGGEID